MQAWLLDEPEGIDTLRLAQVDDPKPGDGEVLLDVIYAALNPADRYLAEGQYPAKPELPHILGRDGVGIVRAVAPKVSGIKVGETYAVLRGETGVNRAGTFAQKVAVPADSLVQVPKGWTLQQASCATLVYLTAYQAISQWTDLPKKAIVLITGASGGVGVAAIQLASAMGHQVVGLSRSEEKRKQLHDLGASITLDPKDDQWTTQLRQQLGDPKVDLAIDNIGGELFNRVLSALGNHGRISCVGRLAGAVPEFNTASLFFRRIKIGGVAVGAYTNAESRAAWKEVVGLMNRDGLRPLIDGIYAFAELPKAFARLGEGPMGKVVVQIASEI
jgi:NADPH2:quinone reductase